jgi:hypothetical protein
MEVHNYLVKNGGDMVLVRGNIEDILTITGITKKIETFDTLNNALFYCHEHFPHVIEFIFKQKDQATRQEVELGIGGKDETKFFTDETKETPDIEKILGHSITLNASDIHLQAGKCITYRVEGVLVQMTEYPTLTEKHLEIVKEALLVHHPKTKNDLETDHDVDFGYLSEENDVSFRVNGFWALGKLGFSFRRIEKKAKTCEEL